MIAIDPRAVRLRAVRKLDQHREVRILQAVDPHAGITEVAVLRVAALPLHIEQDVIGAEDVDLDCSARCIDSASREDQQRPDIARPRAGVDTRCLGDAMLDHVAADDEVAGVSAELDSVGVLHVV